MKATHPTTDVLVPVVDTPGTPRTVDRAVARLDADATLHLVALVDAEASPTPTIDGLDRTRRRAARALDARGRGRVVSAGRTVDVAHPAPEDVAAVLAAYARERGVDRVEVPVDVERAFPGVTADALVAALRDAGVAAPRLGPTDRTAVHRRLRAPGSAASSAALFALSFAFYLLLAGRVNLFEATTGAATAAVVAVVFGRVTFSRPPALARSATRTLRSILYVPYLLWAVLKANVAIAAVVLHPRLPVDPELVTYRSTLDGELALTTFANSVTLTPGTLTVDADAETGDLLVHTLTASSRADLLDGALERAVRYVFDGRDATTGDGSSPLGGRPEEPLDD
jgi:multicomponent Na+:H+ antiporter subunit E